MSASRVTIKPNNHRIYQAPHAKKVELLKKIIEQNSSEDILVVCSSEVDSLKEKLSDENITIVEDRELVKDKTITSDFLISYDMPIEAIVYVERLGRAKEKAVMLLDESEQKALHSIEMLLGRAIKQEVIEGFEYPQKAKPLTKNPARKKLTKEEIQEIAKKRYENSTRPREDFDAEKSDNEESRKPKRDFRDKPKKDDKYAKKRPAPKVTGKKISIKARKVKED